jgi:glucan phosphoethanolaminetransferase (alkaline phosphatase superfamily)
LLLLALLSGYTSNFLWNFGSMPSVGIYYSLLNTVPREVFEYLTIKIRFIILLAILAAIYLKFCQGALGPFRDALSRRGRKWVVGLSSLGVAVTGSILIYYHFSNPIQALACPADLCVENSFPLGFCLGAGRAAAFIFQHRGGGVRPRLDAVRSAPVAGREVVMLVIGESASSNYWSLNGYPYPTNARIQAWQDTGDLVYFPRAYAQANLTQFAVPMIVTGVTPADFVPGRAQPSLLTAFKEIGFTTHWLSNQELKQYPGDADSCLIISDHDFPGRKLGPSYDENLLPLVDTALSSPQKKLFIAVHLMGSHATYSQRVPPGFETPGLAGKGFEQEYVRTICYTDFVLDALIGRLARLDGRCFLWYVSDHGEIPQKWDVGHGLATPAVAELQIPMLVWGNRAFWSASAPAKRNLLAHRRESLSQGVSFPTILGLAGITCSRLDRTRDLGSDRYRSGQAQWVIAPDGKPRAIVN